MQKALRYWHTLRYLRAEQIAFQLLRRVRRIRPRTGPCPDLRAHGAKWTAPITGPSSFVPPARFTFFGESGDLHDIGWDGPQRPLLWRYNQHYFADLLAINAKARTAAHNQLIDDWIASNPPGEGTGWHAYPTSLRTVAWIKWALAGNDLSAAASTSLADQARWLSRNLERHILGNHLFVNAKALFFAGLWFEGPEADTWRDLGLKILEREFPEQILADGGHFELSPMYHILALEDVLDLINIAQVFPAGLGAQGTAALAKWEDLVPDMLHWMAVMRHPDGETGFFNDAAIGVAPTPAVAADYAARLNLGALPTMTSGFTPLRASGYARAHLGPAVLLADMAKVGPDYLPGHAHADTLSFELSIAGHRLVVNGGTSVYGTGAERLRQRGTAAHATAMIDGQNSSDVWSGFRVAQRAQPRDLQCNSNADHIEFGASHTGYLRLPNGVLHHRRWILSEIGLRVIDRFSGEGAHDIALYFPIAPDWTLRQNGHQVLCQHSASAAQVDVTAAPEAHLSLKDTTWHPEFGVSLPAQKLEMQLHATLPFEQETCFSWHKP